MKQGTFNSSLTIKSLITQRIDQAPADVVWTPVDFLDLSGRDTVDKTLQRMVASGDLRRFDRGLYSRFQFNALTGQFAVPDYRSVIDAVGRRDQARMLIDGMTAANDLGLTNAVPGQVIIHTDGRLRPIQLENLTIQFKLTAPSKLYWAGHPAMRIVQALYWLRDSIKDNTELEADIVKAKLIRLLRESNQSDKIRDDLQTGLHTVPSWMQQWIRELLAAMPQAIAGQA
ncbi:MAG: protein of unknown function (DUF4095) [Glomeribacter sp. 1016415]|nr:protein of unknown function (DUF4095) [Glomeribacter sp. 1016415]